MNLIVESDRPVNYEELFDNANESLKSFQDDFDSKFKRIAEKPRELYKVKSCQIIGLIENKNLGIKIY